MSTDAIVSAAEDWATWARRSREFLSPTGQALLKAVEAAERARTERVHPFPGNVLVHVNDMWSGDSLVDGPDQARNEVRTPTENLDAAMVVTSDTGRTTAVWRAGEVERDVPLHRPVLDLDMPVTVLESSTPGHSHVFIDHAMTWPRYLALLEALVAAGLLERGYLEASIVRGHTGVRVPWFRKGDLAPNLDGTRPAPPLSPEDRLDPWAVPA